MSDELLDPPLTPAEQAELAELEALLEAKNHFELSAGARKQGLADLLGQLERPKVRKLSRRPSAVVWWSLPLAAAVILAWLVPLGPERAPVSPRASALMEAQNAHLTARLTGAPLPREELDRVQAEYRHDLLASLEADR